MKSILLTGGSGFIGTNLLNSLKDKFKIYVLKRINNKKKSINVNKNIFIINYKNLKKIENLLCKKKINYFINLATHYSNQNDSSNLLKLLSQTFYFHQLF